MEARGENDADMSEPLLVDVTFGLSHFQCPQCKRLFNRKANCKIHMRKHTGETPYQCSAPGCRKKFMWKSSLTFHESNAHGSCSEVDCAPAHPMKDAAATTGTDRVLPPHIKGAGTSESSSPGRSPSFLSRSKTEKHPVELVPEPIPKRLRPSDDEMSVDSDKARLASAQKVNTEKSVLLSSASMQSQAAFAPSGPFPPPTSRHSMYVQQGAPFSGPNDGQSPRDGNPSLGSWANVPMLQRPPSSPLSSWQLTSPTRTGEGSSGGEIGRRPAESSSGGSAATAGGALTDFAPKAEPIATVARPPIDASMGGAFSTVSPAYRGANVVSGVLTTPSTIGGAFGGFGMLKPSLTPMRDTGSKPEFRLVHANAGGTGGTFAMLPPPSVMTMTPDKDEGSVRGTMRSLSALQSSRVEPGIDIDFNLEPREVAPLARGGPEAPLEEGGAEAPGFGSGSLYTRFSPFPGLLSPFMGQSVKPASPFRTLTSPLFTPAVHDVNEINRNMNMFSVDRK